MIEHLLTNLPVLAADAGSGGALVQLLPFVLIFGIFYFLLILPQQKQRRKVQEMLANLKTGDRVLTSGGIYGTIVGFKDANVLQLQVTSQVKLEVARSAITAMDQPEGGAGSVAGRESGQADSEGRKK
ncbi:MAG: preprotein translocase subunit YajC [Terriglobia bacterium]